MISMKQLGNNMSPQVLELFLLALITFFIINKLISVLGAGDDEGASKSKFGSKIKLKDVTSSGYDWTQDIGFGELFSSENKVTIDPKLLLDPRDKTIQEDLVQLCYKIDKFTPEKFLNNAAQAWKMTLTALQNKDADTLQHLVDSRFMDQIKGARDHYLHVNLNFPPEMQYSNVTFFGNSIIIKIVINADIIQKEEWTFIRNDDQTGPHWFLSNIERDI